MLELLEAWPGAAWIRASGTGYLFVNAAHILGIGLLLGAILPLDVRLLAGRPVATVAPVLVPSAGAGLALAVVTGLWLFSVDPWEYLGNPAFLWKLPLIGAAVLNLALLHRSRAWRAVRRGGPIPARIRVGALTSAGLWIAVLLAGRWIGFL
ncbi:DUF2214 domain-containing protein [Rhodobacter sp. NSM]|uniref:DUF2214 domain-containing protein n=1 Tax=Rhodobacter sp. NSM TaxID=3457501 RepID=UPI003FD5E121